MHSTCTRSAVSLLLLSFLAAIRQCYLRSHVTPSCHGHGVVCPLLFRAFFFLSFIFHLSHLTPCLLLLLMLFLCLFPQACQRKISQHPFESMELSGANQHSHHWIAERKAHTYDWNRSEDSLLATYGMDSRGVARDWNEEYQSCRELPKSTAAERVLRDRTMYRVYSVSRNNGRHAHTHRPWFLLCPSALPCAFLFLFSSFGHADFRAMK